jgi:hypothetical protein
MQIKSAAPRDAFTDDQVISLLRDAPDVKVGMGLEVLDQNLNVLEDISDFTESISVGRDSYANLHATATIVVNRIINFSDAILRPYCIMQGSISTLQTTTQTILGVGMSDDFSTGSVDTTKWSAVVSGSATITQSGGQLSMTSPAGATTKPYLVSLQQFNMTGTSVQCQVISVGNQSLVSNEVEPVLLMIDHNNYVSWLINQGNIIPTSFTAGVGDFADFTPYNSAVHKYFRIRESNGQTYWETSADGNTWTIVSQRNNPISMTNLAARIDGGTYASEASSTTAIFDNFSIGTQTIMTSSTSRVARTVSMRFNMGAFYANGDKQDIELLPRSYTITGVDILKALSDPVGESYAVTTTTTYLTAVENILLSCGYTQYTIDQQAADKFPPAPITWAMTDNPTWLKIVNDLLAAIGYAGIWSDWDGRLRVQPYISPRQRSPEWVYDMDPQTSMVEFKRSVERDLFDAPNKWVFVQSNRGADAAPIEGDGIYTYTNLASGDSSVTKRRRTITKRVDVDAADQDSLVAQAQVTIDADMSISTKLSVTTFPNPLHWHFDRMVFTDPEFGALMDVMSTKWEWQVGANGMTQEWTIL